MKTFRKFASVTFVLILSVMITGFMNPQKKIKLRLNLEENKTYKIENITEQEILQDLMGMEQKIIQNFTMGYEYKVLEKMSNGDMKIKITYTHVKFFQDMPMGTTEYDSEKDKDNIPEAAKGYGAVVGETFEILITPLGKITEIKGIDEIIDNIIIKVGGEGDMDEQLKENLKTQFGEDAVKSNIENSLGIYPEKAVKPGHTWTKENLVKTMFSMKVNYLYEFVEKNGNIADIKLTSTLKTEEGQEELELNGMTMTVTLEGNQNGNLHVDIKTGLIADSEITQDIKGDISMNIQGEEMNIPMKIKTISKVKLLN